MSEISLNQIEPDADFWNYIACTKCSLTYSADDTLTIPFWLTECGHVVCNNHLSVFLAAHVYAHLTKINLSHTLCAQSFDLCAL